MAQVSAFLDDRRQSVFDRQAEYEADTAQKLSAQPKARWELTFMDGSYQSFEAHRMSNEDGFTTFTDYTPRAGVEEFVGRVNNVAIKFFRRVPL